MISIRLTPHTSQDWLLVVSPWSGRQRFNSLFRVGKHSAKHDTSVFCAQSTDIQHSPTWLRHSSKSLTDNWDDDDIYAIYGSVLPPALDPLHLLDRSSLLLYLCRRDFLFFNLNVLWKRFHGQHKSQGRYFGKTFRTEMYMHVIWSAFLTKRRERPCSISRNRGLFKKAENTALRKIMDKNRSRGEKDGYQL